MTRQSADPEVVAHRAGNSVERAAAAMSQVHQGLVDVIEADIHVYRGRVEVRHAKVLKPTTRMWEGRTLVPAATQVDLLADVLDTIGPDVELMADLKCFSGRAARRIRQVIPDEQAIIVSTRSWWVLRAFAGRAHTRTLRSCGNRTQLWFARRMPWTGPRTGFAVHERRLTGGVVDDLKKRGDVVFAWGATTDARCRELYEIGVRGLILDDPTILEG